MEGAGPKPTPIPKTNSFSWTWRDSDVPHCCSQELGLLVLLRSERKMWKLSGRLPALGQQLLIDGWRSHASSCMCREAADAAAAALAYRSAKDRPKVIFAT